MRKKMYTGLLQDLKEMLGEKAANEVIYGLLSASDVELIELRACAEAIMISDKASQAITLTG
jgi:hypothetical protein